jgi:hypothetical protein
MTEPTTRLIRAAAGLLDMFGMRTGDGRALTAAWGEPVGHCLDSGEYIYEPTFTASGNTEAERIAEAVAAVRARQPVVINITGDVTQEQVDELRQKLAAAGAETLDIA